MFFCFCVSKKKQAGKPKKKIQGLFTYTNNLSFKFSKTWIAGKFCYENMILENENNDIFMIQINIENPSFVYKWNDSIAYCETQTMEIEGTFLFFNILFVFFFCLIFDVNIFIAPNKNHNITI